MRYNGKLASLRLKKRLNTQNARQAFWGQQMSFTQAREHQVQLLFNYMLTCGLQRKIAGTFCSFFIKYLLAPEYIWKWSEWHPPQLSLVNLKSIYKTLAHSLQNFYPYHNSLKEEYLSSKAKEGLYGYLISTHGLRREQTLHNLSQNALTRKFGDNTCNSYSSIHI